MKTILTSAALASLLAFAGVSSAFADCQSDDKAAAAEIAAMTDAAKKAAAQADLDEAMKACAANDTVNHEQHLKAARSRK
jgi:hypothetical protein